MSMKELAKRGVWHLVLILLGWAGGASAQDTLPPTISNYAVNNVTLESANVSWRTDEPSFCTLFYHKGDGDSYEQNVPFNSIAKKDYSVSLQSLSPNANYQTKVTCRDAANNYQSQGPLNFRTLQPDTMAPFAADLIFTAG
ncbi:MAG: hypothetical protein GX589_04020, partial [Deltaproteobacteria bacterium]|nr:hypothetical protein [Deltaproteobacteria bacterium]